MPAKSRKLSILFNLAAGTAVVAAVIGIPVAVQSYRNADCRQDPASPACGLRQAIVAENQTAMHLEQFIVQQRDGAERLVYLRPSGRVRVGYAIASLSREPGCTRVTEDPAKLAEIAAFGPEVARAADIALKAVAPQRCPKPSV